MDYTIREAIVENASYLGLVSVGIVGLFIFFISRSSRAAPPPSFVRFLVFHAFLLLAGWWFALGLYWLPAMMFPRNPPTAREFVRYGLVILVDFAGVFGLLTAAVFSLGATANAMTTAFSCYMTTLGLPALPSQESGDHESNVTEAGPESGR